MSTRYRAFASWVVFCILSLATAAAMVAGFGALVYGSAYAIPALAEGKTVIADSSAVTAGNLRVGNREIVSFALINLASRPVTINGMGATCTCVQTDQLPMEIPPRSRRALRLWVRPLAAQAGKPFAQNITLYLSTPGDPVSVLVQGTVLKQTAPP